MNPNHLRLRAQYAALTRSRTPDDPELLDARRALRFERLKHQLTTELAQHPAMTGPQLRELATLLNDGGAK